jgi:hypothetical protein
VSDSEINIEKPPGAQPHDVLAHADRDAHGESHGHSPIVAAISSCAGGPPRSICYAMVVNATLYCIPK